MRTVLVAEENTEARAEMLAALARWGYTAAEALDEQSILEKTAAGNVGLILVSSTLLGLNGFELCSRIRRVPATANIPLVLMIPLVDDAAQANGRQAGVDGYLRKPVQLGEFLVCVHRFIPYRSE